MATTTIVVQDCSHSHDSWQASIYELPNSYFLAAEAQQYSRPVAVVTIGDYVVPQEDILEPGEINHSCPSDFSDISTGEFTMLLANEHGKYSPNKSDFIFYKTTWWRKPIKVELGYKRPGTELVDSIQIFRGFVIEWNTSKVKDPAVDAPMELPTVEIIAQDIISVLGERTVGQPADDGTPDPLVFGKVFREMEELADNRIWGAADNVVDFETGNLSQVTPVIAGGATLEVVGSESYEGAFSAHCHMAGGGYKSAYPLVDPWGALQGEHLHSARMRFTKAPGLPINNNCWFMGLQSVLTSFPLILTVIDGMVCVSYGGAWNKTSWKFSSTFDQWIKVTLGYRYAITGTGSDRLRLWVDGDLVLDLKYNGGLQMRYFWAGLKNPYGYDEEWECYVDQIESDNEYYSLGYYLPGGPYKSFDKVWGDGSIIPKRKPVRKSYEKWLSVWAERWRKSYGGTRFPGDSFDPYPDYGLIDWVDKANPPTGGLIAEATKGDVVHPARGILDILEAVGLIGYTDYNSFMDVVSAFPDDRIGFYADNQGAGEVIAEIGEKALYEVIDRPTRCGISLKGYAGQVPVSPVATLDRTNCFSFESSIDQSNIITTVITKWGWQEKFKRFFYRAEDEALKEAYGESTREIDFSFGENVTSDNGDMAKSKADLLLKRMKGAQENVVATGTLELARIELGDVIAVDDESVGDGPINYEVFEKTINLTEYMVVLSLRRYIGESFLVVDSPKHMNVSSAVGLSGWAFLTVAGGAHSHVAESCALGGKQDIVVADAAHSHGAENVDLVQSGTVLSVDNAGHAHAAESITFLHGGFMNNWFNPTFM